MYQYLALIPLLEQAANFIYYLLYYLLSWNYILRNRMRVIGGFLLAYYPALYIFVNYNLPS